MKLGSIMKQAQEMQENMQKAQEELANTVVTGESGGGMVKIQLSGRYEVRKVEIDNVLIGDDKEMLEDLVAAAMNDATRKIQEKNKDMMSGLTGGLELPAGIKLPF